MVKQELAFKCWNCGKPFNRVVTLPDESAGAVLSVKCAACGERCEVKLNNYQHSTVEILRNGKQESVMDWQLPAVLETQQPL